MNNKKFLTTFNVGNNEAELFWTLLNNGPLGATELAKHAGISRTTVYDLVDHLIKVGLVLESLQNGIKKFAVQPPEKISQLLEEKEKNLSEAKISIVELEQIYNRKNTSSKPRLQMFEGKAELQQMMKDLLLYRDITVQAYWPVKKMLELLTPEFMNKFHAERISRNIKLQVIWPTDQVPTAKAHKFLGTDLDLKRQARVAPKNIDFTLGYSVYGNTVRFISSSRENFGFLVESAEMAEMMRGQFEILWNNSKIIKK